MAFPRVYFSIFVDENSRYSRHHSAMASIATDGHETIIGQCCHASQRFIGLITHILSIERPHWSKSSRAPALWRHDRDVNNQNMVVLSIFQGQLAMFTEENFGTKSQCKRDEKHAI